MKNGILYFLHLSKLSWLSRILLLPGIIWLFRVPTEFERKLNPGFVFVLALDILMLILSMMPVPSDKYARSVIRRAEAAFDEHIRESYCGKIPLDDIRKLKAWQPVRRGVLDLEVKLDGDIITPNLVMLAIMPDRDAIVFERATYSLLGEGRVSRRTWRLTAQDAFAVSLCKAQENDTKVDMIFPASAQGEQELFVVTDDFHLREFLAPLDGMIAQSEDIRAFVRGGMLSVKH